LNPAIEVSLVHRGGGIPFGEASMTSDDTAEICSGVALRQSGTSGATVTLLMAI
jgi:hypothetical protein